MTEKQMPKYKCHKEVWAFKIKQIVPTVMIHEDGAKEKGKIIIFPEEEGYQPFEVSKEFMEKHKPQVGGYYVKYKDGYESYSPADAFEEGYLKIEEEKSESNKGYVSGSLLVPLKNLQNWIDSLDSLEWTLNHQIGVKEEMEEFLKNYKNNDH